MATPPRPTTNTTISSTWGQAVHDEVFSGGGGGGGGVTGLKLAPPGSWVLPVGMPGTTTATCAGGELRIARGFWETSVDAVGVEVTVIAAGATVTAAVYNQDATGAPSTLRASSAPVEASGAIGTRLLTLNTPVPAGTYYVGIMVLGATITYRSTAGIVETLYQTTQPTGAATNNCFYKNGLSALPDPFVMTAPRVGMPYIHVRVPAAAATKD